MVPLHCLPVCVMKVRHQVTIRAALELEDLLICGVGVPLIDDVAAFLAGVLHAVSQLCLDVLAVVREAGAHLCEGLPDAAPMSFMGSTNL